MMGQVLGRHKSLKLAGRSRMWVSVLPPAVILSFLCMTMQPLELLAEVNLTTAQMEEFLRSAEEVSVEVLAGDNDCAACRVVLSNGALTHQAYVTTVDVYKRRARIGGRTIHNFRMSYRYNIAAYELNKLLGLNLVPVSVERP